MPLMIEAWFTRGQLSLFIIAILVLQLNTAHSFAAGDCPEAPPGAATDVLGPLEEAIAKRAFSHRGYLTPAELRAANPKELAEALVARLHRECEVTRPPQGRGEAMTGDLMMVVGADTLTSIARHGFANQHLTNSSGGLIQTNSRLRKEELIAGMQLPYSQKMREILPKYTLLNVHRDDVGKFGVPDFYGDTTVVFKKDVQKRTTWTRADSMVVGFDSGPDEFPPRTMKHEFDTARPWKCSGYCEAQVWGPLGIGDVDHLMVKKGTVLSPALKALGVPIFEYDGVSTRDVTKEAKEAYAGSHQATMFKRGEKVWSGEKKEALPPAPENPPTPVKNILADRALADTPTAVLKERFATLPFTPISESNPQDSFSPRAVAFAEIASRGLKGGNEALLREALNDKDPLVRREALLGLSDLPPAKLRPLVIAKLGDPDRNVIFRAVAMAADFADDPQVVAAAEKALKMDADFDARVARELWDRLRAPTFCGAKGP